MNDGYLKNVEKVLDNNYGLGNATALELLHPDKFKNYHWKWKGQPKLDDLFPELYKYGYRTSGKLNRAKANEVIDARYKEWGDYYKVPVNIPKHESVQQVENLIKYMKSHPCDK